MAALAAAAVLAAGEARAEVPAPVAGENDPAKKGLAIAREVDRRDLGFGDSKADLEMILRNAQGDTSTRKLEIRTLEVAAEDEGDKSLVAFHEPRDVRGTALLTWTHVAEPDDQWLYLPALKRVKRISSANKSGPFMGSEFAYEDFQSQEVAKYTYEWLRDEPCPNDATLTCHVVERTPVYESSGYTRQILRVDTAEYRPQQVEFFDRKNARLKTLVFHDYRRYLDQYWRAHRMEMENHQTGKSTTLRYEGYELRTGLSENDFTQASLKRVR